jgi:hypothetical protein
MLLAGPRFGEPDVTGWFVGLSIGFVIVLVVVIVVGSILALATRIGVEARAAMEQLELARDNTQGLNELATTNETLRSILAGARTARHTLEGGS